MKNLCCAVWAPLFHLYSEYTRDGRGKSGDELNAERHRGISRELKTQTYGHSSSKKENNLRKWKTEVAEEFLEWRLTKDSGEET